MKGWGSKILDNRIMAWNWDNERDFAVSVVVGGIDCETKSKTKTKLKWIDSEICWGKCVWVWGEGGEKERIDQFKNSYTFNIIYHHCWSTGQWWR